MVFLSGRFYILSWVFTLALLTCFFFCLTLTHLSFCSSIFISFEVYSTSVASFLSVSLLSNAFSSLFSCVICFISLVVFLFTYLYFSSYKTYSYFLWLTFLFVCSMLVVVNFYDLFFVLLGWDGLGIVSYFLITYYQSPESLWSSLVTVLLNRLGDVFFMVAVSIWFLMSYSGMFAGLNYLFSDLVGFFLVLAFMTKSAIFPFSPWLPEAMAAPTPISALVHSSTLVAAGLYLIIRNYELLISNIHVSDFLVVVGVFTSFYAGLSSLVQPDLKKVVALSTLSHLGFICFALGMGWLSLAFFHLLTHALFKSSLFIGLGSYISLHLHYQDSRHLTSLHVNILSSSVMFISVLNLVGLPFLSGFYSKDLVLEALGFGGFGMLIQVGVYFNLITTFGYSLRILYSLISKSSLGSFTTSPPHNYVIVLYSFMIGFLSSLSVCFGAFWSLVSVHCVFFVPILLKLMPLTLLVLTGGLYFFQKFFMSPSSTSTLFDVPIDVCVSMFYLWSAWLEEKMLRTRMLYFWENVNESVEYGTNYLLLVKGMLNSVSFCSTVAYSIFVLNWRFSFVLGGFCWALMMLIC